MLTIQNLSMAYGARTLYDDASFQLQLGCRYGVVGANGSGKSTLLRAVAGTEEATSGTISMPKGSRVGVLTQDHFEYEDVPIIEVVMRGIPELWDAMQEKEEILKAAESGDFDADRYSELEDIVLAHDGYMLEPRAAEILEGLNIPSARHWEPLSVLSGGYKLRVLMAKTLAAEPDILLLDEPTNHLDIVSIAWLENFLLNYRGLALIVSHDHRFLDTVSTHIIDVDYEQLTLYPGNYESFERQKKEERARKEAEIAKREQEIADHKKFIDRFKAKATKARQAQSKMKQMEKIEIVRLPESSRRYPAFKISPRRPTGKVVLTVDGLSKSFDGKPVLEDVSFTVQRGDRLAIIGPNGVGKSTLLKITMGEHEPDAGSFEWGYETDIGYFSQDLGDIKSDAEASVQDWLWNHCPDKPMGFVRGKLAEVLFGKDDVDKKVGALSGGELARLAFARLGIEAPTVLVLDEPTNHLDLEGIQALAEGLRKYEGPILFVSHDRWFVSKLATRILEIRPDGVDDYRGKWDDYLHWREQRAAKAS